ncbi:hypothetical protein L6452_39757 [Arctium lappa]|uniref:Uncharacterized protein n=1 Tax=Arctium lappa TaxID=4217 RepID=A0ACB8XT80_ARCLA|nr:hypothetical protein L6452_39757 [Arctium lappa]
MASTTTAAREHVEEIRKTKFSIGGDPNPLTEDLHQAVKNLSAELYAKDVHFFMELIQNAEDNEYPEGVDPSLEFVITSKDITNTGAPATLLVFNNEKGFSPENIASICGVGRSTKKGLRKRGYIGEKGIGFKSVFLITSQPYIFSNGYQIRFNERPCQHCNVGYIVPEWVDDDQLLSAIESVYGSSTALPTTTLVLPLKPEKVKPVKDQLSSVHPEVLLFLSKIKHLSVKEDNEDPNLKTVSTISISSEKNLVISKSMDADSYMLYLTADDDIGDEVDRECGYHMWKQRFPVKEENKVDVRMEVEEWVITLAFPIGERLKRGSSLPGIYSFLPTETITNFPFIIQADFLLASSRENILWDNKWNQGILNCIPIAFLQAFTHLVMSTVDAPDFNLPNKFWFLPVNESSHPKLNHVRDTIKAQLKNKSIVPCESYTEQKLFRKPTEVGRLKPEFWSILTKARNQGVSFNHISSHDAHLLSSSLDDVEYNVILDFLGIKPVDPEWYAKCIAGSDLVMGVSEDVYLQLLVFIAEFWGSLFQKTNIKNIPIIKYVGMDGKVDLFKINSVSQGSGTNKLLAADSDHIISWLINWNTEFRCSTGKFFLPKPTQEAIGSCSNKQTLVKWLKDEVKVKFISVYEYAEHLSHFLHSDRKLAVTYAHFLYRSLQKKHLMKYEVENLCSSSNMPIVNNYGEVTVNRSGVLVPSNGSKWVELIGLNPWKQHNYVELGEDYMRSKSYFGIVTSSEELLSFLREYVGASDIPHLSPPNAAIPTLSSPLTKTNTFLLLNWLHHLRTNWDRLPERFLSSIKHGSWLKISLSGSPNHRPPSESFMLDSSIGHLLQNGSVLVDIPLLDVEFYGDEIKQYEEELRIIGVRFRDKDACEFIGERLMSLASSSMLTRDNVLSILKFIRYLGAHYLSQENFIDSIREEEWLRTSRGYMTPSNSILFSQEWNAASQISDIPFIDQDYYGKELLSFEKELKMLGVSVEFNQSYQFVLDNLKSSSSLFWLSSDAVILILRCIQNVRSSDKVVQALKNQKCLKTNLGYRCPSECFLLNPDSEWGCLLQVFGSFPVLDRSFYGNSIFSMANELKKLGVMVEFEDASKAFTRTFKQQVSSSSIRKENVLSFLSAYRKLKTMKVKFPSELKKCIRQEKWLRTRLGDYRSPNECILFGLEWEPISPISLLPFIDDSDHFYGKGIHDYRIELKRLGVITDFKDGAKFVVDGLFLPQDSSNITSVNVYALLDSVKKLKEINADIPDVFLKKVSQKNWLRTHFGYKRPNECLLFCSKWDQYLKPNVGPFIDEGFYGSTIRSYSDELKVVGVVTNINEGCKLIAGYLNSHSNFDTICRIYHYLSEFNWQPVDEVSRKIWIPLGVDKGEWVSLKDCVLYDEKNLFGEQLKVLEKFEYPKDILNFFARVFDVKFHPSVDDYCKLWTTWESSKRQITHVECCAFWEFVVWNSETEDTFIKNLSKLPVLDPTSGGIILCDKCDVFIGDDLFLMDLFRSSSRPIFVWYPQPCPKGLTRTMLVDIYIKLGVRTLSESAPKTVSDVDISGFEAVDSREKITKRGLFKLFLGFLADPRLKLEVKKRHEAVSRLLALEAFETLNPMTVGYRLSLSSGDVIEVEAKQMIRWDKQNSKLFMQKLERSNACYKDVIEYGSHFGKVIAEGVLWENEEFVGELSELIRLGFLVEFDEEAVDFLMKIKNLQIFLEDQNYLSSTFSS